MSDDHHDDARESQRVRRLEALLEERGVVTPEALEETMEYYVRVARPANGAQMVARAWVDSGYRDRLAADGSAAARELGFPVTFQLLAAFNAERVHNVVVCTLCSCYPTRLLGPSPSWYKSSAYRARVVREPRAVLADFNMHLPHDAEIMVWDSNADTRYLVVPRRPPGSERLDETSLAALVTRRGMIGTAVL